MFCNFMHDETVCAKGQYKVTQQLCMPLTYTWEEGSGGPVRHRTGPEPGRCCRQAGHHVPAGAEIREGRQWPECEPAAAIVELPSWRLRRLFFRRAGKRSSSRRRSGFVYGDRVWWPVIGTGSTEMAKAFSRISDRRMRRYLMRRCAILPDAERAVVAGQRAAIDAGRRGVIPAGIRHGNEPRVWHPREGERLLAARTVSATSDGSQCVVISEPTRPPDQAWPA